MRTITSIGFQEAQAILNCILEEAIKDPLEPVAITIVDAFGTRLTSATMDGTPPASVTVADAKAYTVIRTGKGTDAYAYREPPFNVDNWADPGMTAFDGGVPIVSPHDGSIMGAVGVSGRKQEEDHELASRRPSGWSQ